MEIVCAFEIIFLYIWKVCGTAVSYEVIEKFRGPGELIGDNIRSKTPHLGLS